MLNQISLPPSQEVQREVKELLRDDKMGFMLVASAQLRGRLANNIEMLQKHKSRLCLLLTG